MVLLEPPLVIRHPGSRYSAGSLSQILGFRGVTPDRIPPSAPTARSRGASGGGPVERCMGEAPLSTAVLGQTLCVERWRTVPTSNPPHSARPLGRQGAHVHLPRWPWVLGRLAPCGRSNGWVQNRNPNRPRMTLQCATGRAVPSPEAHYRATLKKKMCVIKFGKDF